MNEQDNLRQDHTSDIIVTCNICCEKVDCVKKAKECLDNDMEDEDGLNIKINYTLNHMFQR